MAAGSPGGVRERFHGRSEGTGQRGFERKWPFIKRFFGYLDTPKPCTDAGFNKMPVPKANLLPFKINDLQSQSRQAQKILGTFLQALFVYNRAQTQALQLTKTI
jgi:hypothetical protein